jgi:putative membrane protein
MEAGRLFKSWLLLALGVLIAANTAGGIRYEDGGSLVVAVLLLSLCNVFLKPLLVLFSLPFVILTFGLGIWLINALLFMFVGYLVEGFQVDGFGYALWGAFVVSLTGWLASVLFGSAGGGNGGGGRRGVSVRVHRGRPDRGRSGSIPDEEDVIDV